MTLPPSHQAIAERLAAAWSTGRGPQGWILAGPAGIGKAAVARAALARLTGRREGAPDPDHVDLAEEIDDKGKRKGIPVDRVREATAAFHLTSVGRARRTMLIAPADALGAGAANALLKTLEEPPPGAVIVLTAHALGDVPLTIRSRCAVERMPAPTREEALARLAQDGIADDDAARLLALADGNPGLARSLHDAKALALYDALLGVLDRPQPFERTGLQKTAETLGGAWETARVLVPRLLHRAQLRLADPLLVEGATPTETRVLERLGAFGPDGLGRAWDFSSKIRQDTDQSNLDVRYAAMRLLLAIEHGGRQAA